MKKITKFSPLLLAGLFVLFVAWPGSAAPTPMFAECPAIGNNSGCAILITIAKNGSITTAIDNAQGPYDGIDDTLVGVLNNSSSPVNSLHISGNNIFGFEGDGICYTSYVHFTGSSYCTANDKAGIDPGDYEGPTSTFVYSTSDTNNGTVNFSPAIAANGGSTFFSLEEAPTVNLVVTPGGPSTVPEPASVFLFATGLGLAGLLICRKRQAGVS